MEKIIRIIVTTALGGVYRHWTRGASGRTLLQIEDPFREETQALEVSRDETPARVLEILDKQD